MRTSFASDSKALNSGTNVNANAKPPVHSNSNAKQRNLVPSHPTTTEIGRFGNYISNVGKDMHFWEYGIGKLYFDATALEGWVSVDGMVS
jgi:hypothetical protein